MKFTFDNTHSTGNFAGLSSEVFGNYNEPGY